MCGATCHMCGVVAIPLQIITALVRTLASVTKQYNLVLAKGP